MVDRGWGWLLFTSGRCSQVFSLTQVWLNYHYSVLRRIQFNPIPKRSHERYPLYHYKWQWILTKTFQEEMKLKFLKGGYLPLDFELRRSKQQGWESKPISRFPSWSSNYSTNSISTKCFQTESVLAVRFSFIVSTYFMACLCQNNIRLYFVSCGLLKGSNWFV